MKQRTLDSFRSITDNRQVAPESYSAQLTDGGEEDEIATEQARQENVRRFYGSASRSSNEPDMGCEERIFPDNGAPGTEDGFVLTKRVVAGVRRSFYRCCFRKMIDGKIMQCEHEVRSDYWDHQKPENRGCHRKHKFTAEAKNMEHVESQPRCLYGQYADVYRQIARNICVMNLSQRMQRRYV